MPLTRIRPAGKGASASVLIIAVSALAAMPSTIPPVVPSGFRYWDPMPNPIDFNASPNAPKTLSATGLYLGTPGKDAQLIPQAWHYEVNVPAWNDGALKRHWVVLKPGRSISFKQLDDYWGYPDSAVFVDELAVDTITGDSSSRMILETRFLMNRKDTLDEMGTLGDHWYGFSYRWRKSQQEADLVDVARGLDDSIRVWSKGTGAGKARSIKKWHFPTVYQCATCHRTTQPDTTHGRSLLGFFTAQLNRPAPDSEGVNQLDWLFAKGVLSGKRPAAWDLSPRWAGIEDKSASLDVRARSYIAANCSGCHGRRGLATAAAMGVDLDFDFHTMEAAMDLRNRPVSWPFGLDTVPPFFYPRNDPANPDHLDSLLIEPALVVPWYPEKSVLIFRERSRDTLPGDYDPFRNQMPPLGTYEVNAPAVAVLDQWVREMGLQAATGLGHGPRRPATGAIRVQGRLLLVAPAAGMGNLDVTGGKPSAADAGVSMVSLDGRRVDLRRLSPGVYELPAGLPKGLYLIRAGTRSLLRSLL